MHIYCKCHRLVLYCFIEGKAKFEKLLQRVILQSCKVHDNQMYISRGRRITYPYVLPNAIFGFFNLIQKLKQEVNTKYVIKLNQCMNYLKRRPANQCDEKYYVTYCIKNLFLLSYVT
jgi:hypothetical protein